MILGEIYFITFSGKPCSFPFIYQSIVDQVDIKQFFKTLWSVLQNSAFQRQNTFVLILALSIQNALGMYFLIHPEGQIDDERMVVHCLKLGSIWLYIPSDLKISLGRCDFSRASENLLVVRDVQPNTPLLSAVYAYNRYTTMQLNNLLTLYLAVYQSVVPEEYGTQDGMALQRASTCLAWWDRLLFRLGRGIAADGELQSGHARSHHCETSSSIITSPRHKTDTFDFSFCEVYLCNCGICLVKKYLGCCVYSRKLLLVV